MANRQNVIVFCMNITPSHVLQSHKVFIITDLFINTKQMVWKFTISTCMTRIGQLALRHMLLNKSLAFVLPPSLCAILVLLECWGKGCHEVTGIPLNNDHIVLIQHINMKENLI